MIKNPSVVCTELDEGAVLLNLDSRYYFNLNETGLRIWQMLDETSDSLIIAQKLSEEYDVAAERSRTSVIRLMQVLEKEELII
ncbi:MAG: PqqD family protein [Nitrospiraceae bacterium]|nr:MAG: PqqD family protein [Nitrospiraceae bacterium]